MPKKPIKFYLTTHFSKWNWFEVLLLVISFAVPLTVGLVFASHPLEIILSIMLPIGAILAAKGLFISRITAIAIGVLYIIVSFWSSLYGEVIITAFIFIPIKVYGLFVWFGNRAKTDDGKASGTIKVSKTSTKELVILFAIHLCIGGGAYFLLRSLGTAFLWVSVISAVVNSMATWLLARRSILAFPAYLVLDVIQFTLWLLVFLGGDQGAIALVTAMVLFVIIDTYGMCVWLRMRKQQATVQPVQPPPPPQDKPKTTTAECAE